MVVITSGKLIDELRQATDNELSFMGAVKEVYIKIKFSFLDILNS